MYILSEFLELEQKLEPFIKEHNLDIVTVKSLVRGSVEILEPEYVPVSTIKLYTKKMDASSIKFNNIKINLKFALNSIFSFKSFCGADGIWLILSILKAVEYILSSATITFEKNDAIVLYCIYRLRNATESEILDYQSQIIYDDKVLSIQEIMESLKNLKNAKTIDIENNKYYVCESIIVRN